MNGIKTLDKRYQTIAWGALLILLGSLSLIPGEQNAIFVLGAGIILLGLNLARYISKIPMNGFTITLGVLVSALGSMALLRPALNFPRFELPLFPLLLIAIGLYLLIPSPKLAATDSGTVI